MMTRTLQLNGMTLAMYLLRTNQIKRAPKTVSFKQLKAVSDYCDSILLMHEYMEEIYTIKDIKELYIDLDEFKKILKEAK